MKMKLQLTSTFRFVVLALLILGFAAIGYQVASAQNPVEPDVADAPSAPTGLIASWDVNGVLLEWDDPDDDTIVGYRIWRRYHRDSHESSSRPPVDDELEMHVRHTGEAENHFHDGVAVDFEAVYGYAVGAIGADDLVSELSSEVIVTTPSRPGQEPDEVEGLTAEFVDGDVVLTWRQHSDETITGFHISRTSEDDPDGGHWIHLTNSDHTTTSYIDYHGLEHGSAYVYTVSAQNENGAGQHSDAARVETEVKPAADATPEADGDPPSAPANVSAETSFADGSHKVVLSWDEHASDQGVTDWVITRWDPETNVNRGHTRIGGLDHTYTEHEDADVARSTTYSYTVHAVNEHGHGEYSDRVTVTTGHEEAAPEPAATPTGQ